MVDKNSAKIQAMFDKIAPDYDFFNNLISFYFHKNIKNDMIKRLKAPPNAVFADLCCGTGDISKLIFKNFENPVVFCVDFSHSMLDFARKNAPFAKIIEASVLNIPLQNNSLDYAIVSFGFRNVENIDLALTEAYRILKTNGTFLHLDFNGKHILNKIFALVVHFFVSVFRGDISSYNYLIASINEYLTMSQFDEKLSNAGFTPYLHKKYFFGALVATYARKN